MMKKDTYVSILCITYNHIQFIEKALKGFLMQKTDFEYEIIIHDDVSTDGTRDVLFRYKEMYPDKIHLILQEENQYSKGVKILSEYMLPKVRGKYIALCEGDDEWIYDGKLQYQYDLMEANKNISLCTHNAIKRDFSNCEKEEYVISGLEEGYVDEKYIFLSKYGHIPTASYFLRTEYIKEYPEYMRETAVDDDPIRFHLLTQGDIFYIDKAWSVWNYMHEGSWNCNIKKIENAYSFVISMMRYYQRFQDVTGYKYNKYIREKLVGVSWRYFESFNISEMNIDEFKKKCDFLNVDTKGVLHEAIERIYFENRIDCVDYYGMVLKPFLNEARLVDARIFVYGAGKRAFRCGTILKKYNEEYDGYIVSDGHKRDDIYMSHKVYEISDIQQMTGNVFIILGLIGKNKMDVYNMLNEKGYNNILL